MKTICITTIFVLTVVILNAQPCKLVKPGMNYNQVKVLVGEPDDMSSLGFDDETEIAVWHYGNQRIHFQKESVQVVIADADSYDELVMLLVGKKLTQEQFEAKLSEINRLACK